VSTTSGDLRRVPVRSRAASWQCVDGETVVLDGDAGRLVGLNGVGGHAWELIDGARTVDEIARMIAGRYGAPPDRVAADVVAFIDRLHEARLVELRDLDTAR
jgi:hypothetical protein